jgi:hypothetical protein
MMSVKASRGIGGWLVTVTTWARGEDAPRVSLFDVAKPDPKDAMDAVRRACGAPADAVAIKNHLTKGALALMRIEPGHMRMRKSLKRPRDIHELTQRIREMDTSEDQGSGGFKRKGRS